MQVESCIFMISGKLEGTEGWGGYLPGKRFRRCTVVADGRENLDEEMS